MFFRNLGLLRDDPLSFLGLLLASMVALLIAITIHELSHGLAAAWLGDDTAKRQGRLTLNPLAHLDPIGTILLFLVGFGWGKPVPVNAVNLRLGARRGMALVGVAGPLSNLLTAGLFAMPLRFAEGLATQLFFMVVFFNIVLAIFNLIPLPPLDGFRVALGVLPQRLSLALSKLELYGPMLLIGVLAVDSLSGLSLLGRAIGPFINLFAHLFIGSRLL